MASLKNSPSKKLVKTSPSKKASTRKTFQPIESGCYYFSEEYGNSFRGKYMFLYQKTGVLQLTSKDLVFTSGTFRLDIPLNNILHIETKLFSRIAKPIQLAYLSVAYLDNKEQKVIGLVPAKATLKAWTVWEGNKRTREWLTRLEETPELSSKIRKPYQIPSQSESNRQIIIFLIIIGALLLIGFIREFLIISA